MKLEVLLRGTVCKPGSALLQGYTDNLSAYTAVLSYHFEDGVMLVYFFPLLTISTLVCKDSLLLVCQIFHKYTDNQYKGNYKEQDALCQLD